MAEKPTYEELERRIQELEKSESKHNMIEKELQKSEELFRQLYEKAPLGYQSLDENGLLIQVNQTWLDTLGYTREEVIGKPFADFLHPDWKDHFKENFPRFKSIGEVLGVEFEMVKKNNTIILVSFNGKIGKGKNGNFQKTHCIFHDITELKRAEEELRRYEWIIEKELPLEDAKDPAFETAYGDVTEFNSKRLILDGVKKENLAQMAADVMALLDTSLAVYEANGDYAFAIFKSSWCQHLDTAAFKFCGMSDVKKALACGKWLCHDNCWNDSAKAAIVSGKPVDIECVGGIRLYSAPIFAGNEIIGAVNIGYGNPPKDNETLIKLSEKFNISFDLLRAKAAAYKPRPDFIVELGKRRCKHMARMIGEIIERSQANENLKKSDAKHGKMVANIGDVIVIIDQEGINSYKSPNIEKLFGWKPEEVVGASAWDNVHPDDIESTKKFFKKIMHRPDAIGTMECRYRCKDGSYKWIEFSGINLFHDPDIKGLLGNYRDITERKQAEKALIEKEALFRGLFDHMTSGSAVYEVRNDGSKGADYIIREFNRKSLEMEGKKLEEILGKSLFDLRPNIDDYGLITVMKKVWETGIPAYYPVKIYQDERFSNYYENHIFKLQSGEVVTIYNDVTDQKNQEKELKESEEKFRLMAENMSDVITLMDRNLRFTYVSPSINRLTGFSVEETLKFKIEDIIPPDSYQEIQNILKEEITAEAAGRNDSDRSRIIEYKQYRKNKSIVWVESNCRFLRDRNQKPKGLLVISRDITERKQAEVRLRESEARFKALHNASFGGITIHDKGIILECNRGLSEMTGYSVDELIGMDGLLLIAEKSRPVVMNNILSDYEKPYEAMGLRKNGEEFPIRLEARNIPYKGKQVRTVEFRDITEQKKAEREREKLQAQLTQAQKMESVGRLAGGVAHDFNNMLGVILGHAEFALEKAAENHDLYADLEEIQTAARRSADLTKQLLTFARKQIIDPRMLDLNDTLESMLNMLRRLIGEDIHLAWNPAKRLWPVKMDPSQIDQILVNLCVNARDAIEGVGKLTIETGMNTFDPEYCADHEGFIPGDFVMLAVSDDGCGMDKKTLNNLFEPFFTTKDIGEGTGLGLATVYGIVKQNNGFINVYSEPDQGSTFRIYLPRYFAADETPAVSHPDKSVPTGNETILLVEDEPAILRMTRMMLERKEYSVLSAATPVEAVDLAKTHADKIDLLMTDVVMPEMNGRDLAEQITAFFPDIKLLFMSGYTTNVIAHHGVLDEGVAFIQKPFSMQALAEKVRGVLDSTPRKTK